MAVAKKTVMCMIGLLSITACGGTDPGSVAAGPIVASAPTASDATVTGTSTTLTVLGAHDGSETVLRYTWSPEEGAAGPVTFSQNGTNDAKAVTAFFTKAGAYTLQATITDPRGGSATAAVSLEVPQSASSIGITPNTVILAPAGVVQFAAIARDQFGDPMAQPVVAWSATGGSVIPAGRYTAGPAAGSFSVFAQSGSLEGSASVLISNGEPIVLGHDGVLPVDDSASSNLVAAQRVELSTPATLNSFGFYVTQAGGQLRLALYDASGLSGNPGAKLAESTEITPAVGWNMAKVQRSTALPPGTYWLAYSSNDDALHFRRGEGGDCRHFARPYGVLPPNFSNTAASCGAHWSFYASLTP